MRITTPEPERCLHCACGINLSSTAKAEQSQHPAPHCVSHRASPSTTISARGIPGRSRKRLMGGPTRTWSLRLPGAPGHLCWPLAHGSSRVTRRPHPCLQEKVYRLPFAPPSTWLIALLPINSNFWVQTSSHHLLVCERRGLPTSWMAMSIALVTFQCSLDEMLTAILSAGTSARLSEACRKHKPALDSSEDDGWRCLCDYDGLELERGEFRVAQGVVSIARSLERQGKVLAGNGDSLRFDCAVMLRIPVPANHRSFACVAGCHSPIRSRPPFVCKIMDRLQCAVL